MAAHRILGIIPVRFAIEAHRLARYLANLGTGGYPPDVRRRLKILNVVCYLIALFTLLYSVQHIFIDYQRYKPMILINLALVLVALMVPFVHRCHEMAGGFLIAGAEYVALFVLTAYLGRKSGVQIQYLAGSAEADALLKNVLPASIAERLKEQPGKAISDSYAEATVLFADLVGFTPLAQRLGAAATVDLLNELITELDQLAAENGVEKIKTIGDSFMAAAGVPEPCADHASRMACMAFEIRDAVGRLAGRRGLDLSVRIGMASGPVMAGVIGTRRFIYDIWGDTVNLAARLEQTGHPNRIQVKHGTRLAIQGAFSFENRGVIEIKGMGPQETWFLSGAVRPARGGVVPHHPHGQRSCPS